MAIFLMLVAIIGKVITGFSIFGQPQINRLAIGVGMILRGEVGLVFLGIGSSSGVLSKPLSAVIIMMVILTTFYCSSIVEGCFTTKNKTRGFKSGSIAVRNFPKYTDGN